MPNYQGVWSLSTHYQNIAGWPIDPLGAGMAIFGPTGYRANIDSVVIPTLGNATDWGDFSGIQSGPMSLANSSRIIMKIGDNNSSKVTTIEYHNWAVVGGTWLDFGDVSSTGTAYGGATVANDTRGLIAGGVAMNSGSDITNIEFITIASTGNVTDFGDETVARRSFVGVQGTTRGLFAGGRDGNATYYNIIDYVTIASAGNASDFGDLNNSVRQIAGASSHSRAVIAGGWTGSARVNVMDFVTIANTGNATDFGDLTAARIGLAGANSLTRGLFAGGSTSDGTVAAIDYITIASAGNAADFGDLTTASGSFEEGGTSNCHGGIA